MKLKPCPFCGFNDLDNTRIEEPKNGLFCVTCPECETKGPTAFNVIRSEILWNNRKNEVNHEPDKSDETV